jgi:hypothetical protein
MAEKDILEQYINDSTGDSNNNKNNDENYTPSSKMQKQSNMMGYVSVDPSSLPLGKFYPDNIQIKIRSANVAEVQAFAMVDDRNYIDVTEKLNQLLSSCVKVTYSDGNVGSYKDLKDGDRTYLIFMIRELTFQQGPALSKIHECEHCNHEFQIVYRVTKNSQYPKTIQKYDIPEKLEKYFNQSTKCYEFKIDGVDFRLAPPTIGIQESFFDDLRDKVQKNQKKNPNVSQMNLLQYLLWDRNYISSEGIKKKEQEIKTMEMNTFQILNSAVNMMKVGIKDLSQNCPNCGQEVHSELTFPNGISSLFIISNSFEEFDRQ